MSSAGTLARLRPPRPDQRRLTRSSIPAWYSGTHQIWRTTNVGPEHALSPERYFIIAINQIGSGLSTSPHNANGANAGIAMSRFPRVRIGDDVVAQERLLREHLRIERLALVVGGSPSVESQGTRNWTVMDACGGAA